jgi:DNA-binding NarL/FixJ family response regulator
MTTKQAEILTALEINGITGEVLVRDLTEDELAQRKIDTANATAQKLAEQAKVAARESALAKLAALGLTADEIASL